MSDKKRLSDISVAEPNPAEARELPFEHEGSHFKVTASPGVNGYELALWRDNVHVLGVGFVSWDDISQATKSGFHADLVAGAMDAIRGSMTTKSDPDLVKSTDGN